MGTLLGTLHVHRWAERNRVGAYFIASPLDQRQLVLKPFARLLVSDQPKTAWYVKTPPGHADDPPVWLLTLRIADGP